MVRKKEKPKDSPVVAMLERPNLPPPVTVGGGGKIIVKVSGRLRQMSALDNVVIERID